MEITSGVLDGVLSLPNGGGAMSGLGERFQPDLFKGTGNYSVPISLPAGPNGIRPTLALRYSTGVGNGAFGVGWTLAGLLDIRRRTDRGVPEYGDEDEFTIGGAEVLVAVGGGRYRPRTETRFLHVQRHDEGWIVRSKEGKQWRLGTSPGARCADGARVFAWYVEEERDVAGNTIRYRWESDRGVLYPTRIEWSIYALELQYEVRPDPILDGRAGFERATLQRCIGIERHCARANPSLVARHTFGYAAAPATGLSLLVEVRHTGIAAGGSTEDAPALRFGYTESPPARSTYHRIGAIGAPPPRLGGPITLVDLDGDGLPDILDASSTRHRVWPNRGDGRFGPVRALDHAPMGVAPGRPGVTFVDFDGDGAADLARIDARLTAIAANEATGRWSARPRFLRRQIWMRPQAADTRFVDLDGDGTTDVLQGGRGGMVAYLYRGDDGWSEPRVLPRTGDAAQFPDVDLASEDVQLADMTGDGLADIVFAASGRVEYWPSHGRGRFGARVRMSNAPVLPPRYDPRRLYLTDVNGDGLTDLVYVDRERILIWINQSGVAWSAPHTVRVPAPPDDATIHLVDLLGTGARGVLWSQAARGDDATGWRYLALGEGRAHLLARIEDEAGQEIEIRYTTTTGQRRADLSERTPWAGYLPFVIYVVAEIVHRDRTTGQEVRSRLRYHDGHYDGVERELRGFARVEIETDVGAAVEVAIEETIFFVGTASRPSEERARPVAERRRERALVGTPVMTTSYARRGDRRERLRSSVFQWEARLLESGQVFFPRLASLETRQHTAGERDRIEQVVYEHDRFGNVVSRTRTSGFDGAAVDRTTVQVSRFVANEARWLVGLPSRVETRDRDGVLLSDVRYFYDGPEFEGLPEGQATAGIVRRTVELALSDAMLPARYAGSIDPSWGLVHDVEGWYRTSLAQAHDAAGNPSAVRDPLGSERTIAYDADRLFPIRVTDGDQVAEISFDPRIAQPTDLKLPGRRAVRYVYSPLGRLLAQYDGTIDGVELTRVYLVDLPDLTSSPVRPARVTTVMPVDPGVRMEDVLAARDLTAHAAVELSCELFDAIGRSLQRIRTAPRGDDGNRFVVERRRVYHGAMVAADLPSRRVFEFAPLSTPSDEPQTRFTYDALGRMIRALTPDGSEHVTRYRSDRVERREPGGGDQPIVEVTDAAGGVVAIAAPDGDGAVATTRYTLDALGRTVQVIDFSGRTLLSYRYSAAGAPIRIEHADAGARTYWYDARGVLRLREQGSVRLAFACDRFGRVTSVHEVRGAQASVEVRRFTYDGPDLIEARDGDVVTRYQRDDHAHTSTSTLTVPGHAPAVFRRERGVQGELRAIVYPDGTRIEYGATAAAGAVPIAGLIDAVSYDAYGRPTAITYQRGAVARFAFDPITLHMVESSLSTPAGLVRRQSLEYDAAGEIARVIDTLPLETVARRFSYDRLRRLRRMEIGHDPDGPSDTTTEYRFNATGDLLRGDANPDELFTYGDPAHAGRLTAARLRGMSAAAPVSYDDAGRVTSFASIRELAYDVWGRVTRGTLADGSIVRFAYDHLGRRVAKTVDRHGAIGRTLYMESLYERRDGEERLRVYLGARLVAIRIRPRGGDARDQIVLTDYQGSTIAVVEADRVVGQQVYAPYGLTLRAGTADDRHLGQVHDLELGLSQFGDRYYSPALGRFLSPDWWAFENPERTLRTPLGLVAYGYAGGNPVRLRDPSGRWFGLDDLIVAGIGFVVGFIVGVCVGIAQDKSLGDTLLLGVEAGVLGAAGAWLAYNTAGLALTGLGKLGISIGGAWATGIEIGAAVFGGLNGVISGARQIYDWRSPSGYLAFLADSTWGLVGTSIGVSLHPLASGYREDLSRRRNRHVYDGGPGFKDFAFTQGNVTTNWNKRSASNDLNDHEAAHVLQNRLFGPIFTVTYAVWFIVGGIIGVIIGIGTDQGIEQDFMDVGYYNNPWESWGYHEGGSPNGGTLAW